MKRMLMMLTMATVLAAVLSINSVAFAAEEAYFEISDASGITGDQVEVEVSLRNSPGFGGMAYDVIYDNTALKLVSYERELGSEICTDSGKDRFLNKVNFQYSAVYNIEDDGVLVKFVFEIIGTEPGTAEIKVVPEEGTSFYYDGRKEIDFALETAQGSIIIESGHTHQYGTEWKFDDTNHWRECTCGEKTDMAAHTYGEWTVSVAQDYETAGEKAQLCSRCNAKNICPIPSVKDHILTQDIQTDILNGIPVNRMTVSSGVAVLLASYSTQGQMQHVEVLAEGDGSVDKWTTVYFSLPKNTNLTNRMFFLKPGYIPLCFREVSETR